MSTKREGGGGIIFKNSHLQLFTQIHMQINGVVKLTKYTDLDDFTTSEKKMNS